jgi:antimicrobial peptide system SdpB family protein
MLSALGRKIEASVGRFDPWTNVYGLARSVLALTTAATLVANPISMLFRPGAGTGAPPFCQGARALGAFCVTTNDHLELKRWLCIALLLVVASGWRPRYTGVLHFWITFSLQANALVLDGGDQVASLLTMLLIPVTLTDARAWHWSAPLRRPLTQAEAHKRLFARFSFALIRLQVAGIYFHAAIGKLAVREWKDGTALYYWFNHETFGAPAWLLPALAPVLHDGVTVSLLTWSVLVLEFFLAMGLLMSRRYWGVLLAGGLALHAGILVIHGLVSFGIIMMVALVLYLRPIEEELKLPLPHALKWRRRGTHAVPIAAGLTEA